MTLARRGLWPAFLLVHVGVAVLGFVLPSQPMGDVYRVYGPWAHDALGGVIPGVGTDWVYPQLALVPMLLAYGVSRLGIALTVAWALVVTLADAIAFRTLVGAGRSVGRVTAAWFWLAALLLLGPVALYRIDAVAAPFAIVGCLWLVSRPRVAAGLLAVGAWIKVWPAALIAAAVVAGRRRGAVVWGAAAVSAATIVVVVALGGAEHLFGFIGAQNGRGLQLEAVVSTPFVWAAARHAPGAHIYYDQGILTFQVAAPGVAAVVDVMTAVLAVVVGAVVAVGVWKAWRGATFAGLFPPLGLALVLALIVANKVGSPQYLTWLVAPVLYGMVLNRRRWSPAAVLVLVVSASTFAVYPVLYDALLQAKLWAVIVLTVRNALLVAMFAGACVWLARVGTRARPRHIDVRTDAAR